MAVTLSVTTLQLMQEVTAEVYGIAVRIGQPARGVLPIGGDIAEKIGSALRRQLLADAAEPAAGSDGSSGSSAGSSGSNGRRFFVAVGDAFVAADSFGDEDVAVRLEYVAQRAGRLLTGHRSQHDASDDEHRADGNVAVLRHLALDPDGPAEQGKAALFDLQDRSADERYVEFILPIVLAGSPGQLFAVTSDFVQARFESGSPVHRAVETALQPQRLQALAPCTRLDVLRADEPADEPADEDGDGDGDGDAADGCGPRSAEIAFLDTASRHAGADVVEVQDLGRLAELVPQLQADARSSGRPRLVYVRGVALVVAADLAYVGFKTVDELGRRMLDDPAPSCDGTELGMLWSDWFTDRYMPVVSALLQAGVRTAAFPLSGWSEVLAASGPLPNFEPGTGALRPLDQVHIEASTHDLTDGAEGARVLCRLMLDDRASLQDGQPVDPGSTPVLCSVVRVVDDAGRGVSQSNIYVTLPSAAGRHHEYAGSLAQFHGLPVEAGMHELVVCDRCLKLVLPPGDEETAADDDGGSRDEVRLRYIAPPRHGRLH